MKEIFILVNRDTSEVQTIPAEEGPTPFGFMDEKVANDVANSDQVVMPYVPVYQFKGTLWARVKSFFDFSGRLRALEAENERLRTVIDDKFEPRLIEYKGYGNVVDLKFHAPPLIAMLAKQLDDWFTNVGAKNNITCKMAFGVDDKPNDKVTLSIREYDVTVQRRWGESVSDQRNQYRAAIEKIALTGSPVYDPPNMTCAEICDWAIKRSEAQKKLLDHMVKCFHMIADDFNMGDMPLVYENLATEVMQRTSAEYFDVLTRLRKLEEEQTKVPTKPNL